MKIQKLNLTLILITFGLTAFAQAETSKTISEELEIKSDAKVIIKSTQADIFITASKGNQVEMVAELSVKTNDTDKAEKQFKQIKVKMEYNKNNDVVISVKHDDDHKSWFGSDSKTPSVNLRVTIPENHDTDITTASGDLNIQEVNGKYSISSASGDMKLTKIDGPINIQSASGDIKGKYLNGSFSIKTASGDVEILESNLSEIKATCASGDLTFSLDSLPSGPVSITTASGDIELIFPVSPDAEIEIVSNSGDYKIGFPIEIKEKDGDRKLTATSGSGKNSIEVKSHSGDVFLRLK